MTGQAHPTRSRLDDLLRFYALLARLQAQSGGPRRLSECHGRMAWPARGVYFFMEPGQHRTDSGSGLRIIRVGTHALSAASKSTLWQRLAQHKGQQASGGGNHRGSIFRLLLGSAMIESGVAASESWGVGATASREIASAEQSLEQMVSTHVGGMPFLWLDIDDAPGPASLRGYIERNSIGLLSNFQREALHPPSTGWLGHTCRRGKGRVRDSGLWNQNHVDEQHEPRFLDVLEKLIEQVTP